jgi:hypothetical protein
MILKSRPLLLAAALMAAPLTVALAQGTTPGVSTGTQGTSGDSLTTPKAPPSAAATDPYVKGATGQTVVKGSGSSMADSNRVVPNPNAASTTAAGAGGGSH